MTNLRRLEAGLYVTSDGTYIERRADLDNKWYIIPPDKVTELSEVTLGQVPHYAKSFATLQEVKEVLS